MKIKIPKGWRKLRKGTVIERGDKFKVRVGWERSCWWGEQVGGPLCLNTYIRRIKKGSK
jgi:hypothetical protein